MSARVNTANRTVLLLLAVLLLVAAAVGLAIGFGARVAGVTLPRSPDPVLSPKTMTAANDSPWFWWAVAAGCVVIALLAARWLLAQFATDRAGNLDLTENDREGTTTLTAGAVGDAVATEAKTCPGVEDASAHLRERPTRALVLTVDVAEYADLGTVRSQLETGAIAHARHAIDEPDLPVHVEFQPTRTRRAVA